MKCQNCKWWGGAQDCPREDSSGIALYPAGWRSCNAPGVASGYGEHAAAAGAKAQVDSGEGYGLATAPDFGCVLFEQ
jgi:hypothetical protein